VVLHFDSYSLKSYSYLFHSSLKACFPTSHGINCSFVHVLNVGPTFKQAFSSSFASFEIRSSFDKIHETQINPQSCIVD